MKLSETRAKVKKSKPSRPSTKEASTKTGSTQAMSESVAIVKKTNRLEGLLRPNPSEFASLVAREIVKNLQSFPTFWNKPALPKDIHIDAIEDIPAPEGQNLILIDTSVLIDGRILPIVNSGFLTGTLLIPQFVLVELQHIADASDSLRRAKGRRGLDVVQKLLSQKINELVVTKVIQDNPAEITEVDHKLAALAKQWHTKLLTVDFNLAQLARAGGVKVLNIHDLAQAIKLAILPGEEMQLKITHAGKEREQGVGYLADGTMVIVDNAKDKVGQDLLVVVSRVVNTAAGQLFFARLK